MGLICSAPAEGDFLDQLAESLAQGEMGFAAPLEDSVILLPTRRACLKLQEALLNTRHAMILPVIAPLGDIESALGETLPLLPPDLPEAVDPLERHIALAQFIRQFIDQGNLSAYDQPATIADLALALAQFIDLTDRFKVDRAKLNALAPDRFAEHWQKILALLQIIIKTWPNYLRDRQRMDPIARRNVLFAHFADHLADFDKPLIIAGSTGSQAATAYLLKAAANYRRGMVILPALDFNMDEAAWDNLPPTHPQYGLKHLLEKMEIDRSDVRPWKNRKTSADSNRQRFIRALFRPQIKHAEVKAIKKEFADIDLIEADHSREEAAIIALILRESLEDEAKTAALITPDRNLARRVRLQLRRWHIDIDDEAGMALTTLPCFIFLKLIADMAVSDFAPLAVLSCLKHPLALGGRAAGALRRQTREIERLMRDDSASSEHAAQAILKESQIFKALEDMLAPLIKLTQQRRIHFATFLKAHIASAERLGASDSHSGAELLWGHDEGTEKIAGHLRRLIEKSDMLGDIARADYPQLFEHLFHTAEAAHPHRQIGAGLHIWSPIEARLQYVDLAILGGLNEGVWPQHIAADPWLNRTMRSELGLAPAETEIGQSAHDFTEALAAKRVILTRATKSADGNPLSASPWVLRVKNIADAAKHTFTNRDWQSILRQLHHSDIEAADHAAPQPPAMARPKKLSASALTTLINNPYAFYAERILNLKALAPIEQPPSASERGSLIHDIFHQFIKQHGERLPTDAYQALIDFGRAYFDRDASPIIHHFWWPHFQDMARHFIALENNTLRPNIAEIFTETEGRMVWQIKGEDITLTARADRIDIDRGGRAAIYDYKTGAVPSKQDIKTIAAPQLPLEALILMAGGFEQITARKISRLAHIKLKARQAAHMLDEIDDRSEIIEKTEAHLKDLLAHYLSPDYRFAARAEKYSDYDHLARLATEAPIESEDS